MHFDLGANKGLVSNLQHFLSVRLPSQSTAYLEPDGVGSSRQEAGESPPPAVLTLYQDPALESPEKISHLSFSVSIPEFFQGRAGSAGMNEQMECMVCRAQIMLADGGRAGPRVPEI